jgi:hypothetical protein
MACGLTQLIVQKTQVMARENQSSVHHPVISKTPKAEDKNFVSHISVFIYEPIVKVMWDP